MGSPGGLLFHAIWAMKNGTFVGKTKRDQELNKMIKKYELDELASSKLADTLSRFDHDKRCEFYDVLDRHFSHVSNPSAYAMKMLKKIGDGGGQVAALGDPGPAAKG